MAKTQVNEIIKKLKKASKPDCKKHMARFGINMNNALGGSLYDIRRLAKGIKKNHGLAIGLWGTGIREARLLAAMVADPELLTERQMQSMVNDIDSWDICDCTCSNLFDKTPFAYGKAVEWSEREEEFVKRAGFVLMATLSVHDKKAHDKKFEKFFPIIKREATDERNYVKKAVNWALRQIGKRNLALNKKAIKTAEQIAKIDSKAARWIASDALRELEGKKVRERLGVKGLGGNGC